VPKRRSLRSKNQLVSMGGWVHKPA
jgi:hypothetical protein